MYVFSESVNRGVARQFLLRDKLKTCDDWGEGKEQFEHIGCLEMLPTHFTNNVIWNTYVGPCRYGKENSK